MGTAQGDIEIRRVYDDGVRDGSQTRGRQVFLIDGIWPRGVKKSDLQLDGWLKEAAPSTDLRRWFSHDSDRWTEFRARYRAELQQLDDSTALGPLLEAARQGPVTLLYATADTEHNNALVLREYLLERLRS